jgi:hypothetical protein
MATQNPSKILRTRKRGTLVHEYMYTAVQAEVEEVMLRCQTT